MICRCRGNTLSSMDTGQRSRASGRMVWLVYAHVLTVRSHAWNAIRTCAIERVSLAFVVISSWNHAYLDLTRTNNSITCFPYRIFLGSFPYSVLQVQDVVMKETHLKNPWSQFMKQLHDNTQETCGETHNVSQSQYLAGRPFRLPRVV